MGEHKSGKGHAFLLLFKGEGQDFRKDNSPKKPPLGTWPVTRLGPTKTYIKYPHETCPDDLEIYVW